MHKFGWLLIFSFLLFFGCSTIKIAPDAVELAVDFSWVGVSKCSNQSPEISVDGIPAGTKTLKVKLKDLDVPRWNHGGGTIENDDSGIIPAGSLKNRYNGPCPPSGSHRYEFTVNAVNEEGIIIGLGKAMQSFP